MRLGAHSFGTIPHSSTDIDDSTIPAIIDLIADQESARSYLFHATPYDPLAAAEADVRASIGLNRPILDSAHWPAILRTAADSQVDLFGDDEDAQGRTSFGNIELMIGSTEYDAIASYYWDSRDVEIKLGADGFTIDEYVTVVKGTAEDIIYNQRTLGIVFRGKEQLLDVPVNSNEYAGSGGLEGGIELAGNSKPLAYGSLTNISPVLVDQDNIVYQFHDGACESVQFAFDGGLALTFAGDVADITATTVPAGYFKTQLSGGYIKLGAEPEKLLTLDILGDNTGGYISNSSDIIKRIALNDVGLAADDLNWPSFFTAYLDSSRSVSGIYINGETAADVITELMFSIGGAWAFNRLGKLTVYVLRKRSSSGTITENDIVKGTFARDRTQPPSWKRRIGNQRAWTVLTDDQFLGAATSYQRNLAKLEYRYSTISTPSIKTARAGAREVQKDTLLATSSDADTENLRQQAIFGAATDAVSFTARRQQFKYHSGETITLNYPRFGLSKDMIILGIRENTSLMQTTFRLLG